MTAKKTMFLPWTGIILAVVGGLAWLLGAIADAAAGNATISIGGCFMLMLGLLLAKSEWANQRIGSLEARIQALEQSAGAEPAKDA